MRSFSPSTAPSAARWSGFSGAVVLLAAVGAPSAAAAGDKPARSGREVYEFYCYQCHGYAGNGQTLAAEYLDPPPRDFTAADPESLGRQRMRDAVRTGRDGTGMAAFSAVLSEAEIGAVVDYVRERFMTGETPETGYHTAANGWPNHRERYGAAYPFVTGELPLDARPETLSERQRRGLELFHDACISCHDQPLDSEPDGPIWDPRPVSFPRGAYSHKQPDAVSSASMYAEHDRVAPPPASAPEPVREGFRLFQDNCAFCHGADGSGRNWIGEFMEPKAQDLAAEGIVQGRSEAELTAVLRNGVPGTSMPAWRHVLEAEQIDALVRYLRARFDPDNPSAD